MSMRYKGSRLSATANTPTSLTASGAWTLQQQMQANGTSTWPFVRDPQFNYVTMLLHGDGSAGANNGSGGGATPTVTAFNTDASTNNFNVTINGDARSNNFSPYLGTGYYGNSFNGSTDFFNTAQSANFTFDANFTVEFWVYISTSQNSDIVGTANNAAYIGSGNSGWIISYYTSGGIKFGYQSNNSWVVDTTVGMTPTLNSWNHVAIVRSGSTITGYLNGIAGTTPITSSATITSNLYGVYIGSGAGNQSLKLGGIVSNLRVVKGTAVYTSAFTPSTTPLTAISGTSLLTCQSNRFIDNSTNAFAITTSGTPQVAPAQPFTLPSSVATYGSGYFGGTSGSYLNGTGSSNLAFGSGDFTIELWFYINSVTAPPSYQFIYSSADSSVFANTPVLYWYETSSALRFNNGSDLISTTGIQAKTWYHVAVARSGTTTRMFLNGTQVGSATDTTTYINQPSRPMIGANGNGSGNLPFGGYISDVRCVKGTAVYTTTFTPPTSPLTAITNTQLLTTQYNGGGNNSGFKDSSQNNFAITRNGNTTQGTFTPYGSNWSNYFVRSSSQYLTVSNSGGQFSFGTGAFTIECWINLSSLPSSTGYPASYWIFGGGPVNSNAGIDFYINNTQIGFNLTDFTSPTAIGNHGMSVGTWYHVAVVRGGGSNQTVSIYVNGTRVATASSVTATADAATTGIAISAAEPSGATGGNFDGYISNHRIVKGTAVYDPTQSSLTVPTTSLTAITNTQLLTCQSNRFIDNSSNAFSITTSGSPSVQRFSPFANATAYNPATTGGSGYFDGSGDYLSIPNAPAAGTGSFSFEAWIYLTNSTAAQMLLANATTGGMWIGLNIDGVNRFSLGRVFTAIDKQETFTWSPNTWYHVVVNRSGTNLQFFVNGVQVGTTSTNSVDYSISGRLIGAESTGASYFYGYVSGLRFVNASVYTSAFTPPTSPPTAIASTTLLTNFTNSAILDQSMMNDLETVGNAQISTSVVKYGTASMYFDGTGDWLTVPYRPTQNFGTGAFTIEMWAYLNSLSASYYVPAGTWGSGTSDEWLIQIQNNGSIRFLTTSGSTFYSASITTATWYHIAVVRNGSTVTIYVNGTSVGSYTCTNSLGSTAKTLYIGTQAGTWDWNGYIDDFRITNGVARYTTTFTPPTQALPNG